MLIEEEKNETGTGDEYSSESIQVLEERDHVRQRPGMYIGSTDTKGLHHLIWEIIDNAVDEALAGFANEIIVTIGKEHVVTVEDNGRGIPVDIHPKTKKSTVETVLTNLKAGGKFNNKSYSVSSGTNGVGASCVTFLSKFLKAFIYKANVEYLVEFYDGASIIKPLRITEKNHSKKQGTIIQYQPDFSIFEQADYDIEGVATRLKQLAFLNKGLCFIFNDATRSEVEVRKYQSYGGICEYVREINSTKNQFIVENLEDTVIYGFKKKVLVSKNNPNRHFNSELEIAFQYNYEDREAIFAFCNNTHNFRGGTHYDGFVWAVIKVLNKIASELKVFKKPNERFSREDVLEGMTAIISLRHSEPTYEGQTKEKVTSSEIKQFVIDVTEEVFERFLNEKPHFKAALINKIKETWTHRLKFQEDKVISKRKTFFDSGSLPDKLADCSTRDSSVAEIYIVEGDSAGGSAKMGRNREYQAILPLRGKVINVEKIKRERVYNNNEIKTIIDALGTGTGEHFKIENLRYNKIILMTDADVDGAHIRILLLTFLFRYMEQLIRAGHIYIAQPPLYKISWNKNVRYAYSEADLDKFKQNYPNVKFNLQRYKGLGEMNAEQLWETTMNPDGRILLRVGIEDAILADRLFRELMGDDVSPRKDFIYKNARYVKNIDV